MGMNDTMADFLTRIRNGYRAGFDAVSVAHTKITERIAGVLLNAGYIDDFQVISEGAAKAMVITLKYRDGRPVIHGIRRESKPSRRVYVGYRDIKPVRNGIGIAIISTPAGIMSDEEAKKRQIGGELLASVW